MSKKKNTTQAQTPTIKVHPTVLIATQLIKVQKGNSNKQSRHTFEELKKSILENGFDESIIVKPSADGGYECVSGSHRYLAGASLGMPEFPCVVRDDWDNVKSEIESVRRNFGRGKIDKEAFTKQVNNLASSEGISIDDIMRQMGFEDPDSFSDYYIKEKKQEREIAKKVSESASAVKMIDDLGVVLSKIFADHGDTVPNSFIIFPQGGRNHMYVAVTQSLKNTMEAIAQQCVSNNLDINVALAGLLTIGIGHSNFLSANMDAEMVTVSGSIDTSDADLEIIQ